jgi:hypothetical protein
MHENERVRMDLPYGVAYRYECEWEGELEFDSTLDEWAKAVYTWRWFENSSSSIQTYFGAPNFGVVKGSLRGAWIHKDHLHKIRPREGSADLYKRLGEITHLIEDTRMMHDSSEDILALSQALQRQNSLLQVLLTQIKSAALQKEEQQRRLQAGSDEAP